MNPISRIGSNLADLLSPVFGKHSKLSPVQSETQNGDVQAVLLKAINSTKSTSSGSDSNTTTSVVSNELGKDSFLQLLVQQMQNQDPLDPTDNSQMIAQLAQFSALEQMNNLNDQFAQFSGNLDQLNFITASNMVGRQVSGVGSDGTPIEGTVDGVQLNGSVVYLTIGDQLMSMAGVETIK